MKIATAEVLPYALPFREPYLTARGRLEQREMVLLRLRDEDGLLGLGEAVPLSLRGGASLAEVAGELEALLESGWLHQGLAGEIDVTAGLSAPARCAVETALADLAGRRAGAPTNFAGDDGGGGMDTRRPIECNATLIAGEPAAVAEDALRWASEGFATFKLKLGAGDDDVGQVRAVREALGPSARIRIDANEAWGEAEAIATLRELEPLDVELAEQPVAGLAAMAAGAAATAIPLAADESVASQADAERALAAGACRFTGIKLSKVGGSAEALTIAGVLPAYLSSALDGPVGIASAARLAQTLDVGPGARLAHGLATQRLFATSVAAVEWRLEGGCLHPPPGPGLGVEIDEEALQAHRL